MSESPDQPEQQEAEGPEVQGAPNPANPDPFAPGWTVQKGWVPDTPVAKPVITGSRAGNVALTNLLAAMATDGLITNNTTA